MQESRAVVPRSFLLGFAVLVGVPAMVLLLVVAYVVGPHSSFAHARVGGAFAMTETSGRPVSDRDLAGKPLAITFGFTGCPDVCPTTLLTLGNALQRMDRDADGLNVVFVTLDPQRDTAERMREYLSSFDPRIRGFLGTPAQTAAMADAFHVRYRMVAVDGGTTVDHSAGVSLFDRDGDLVGSIPYDEDAETTLAKLRTLMHPAACVRGAPPRVDLWSGAKLVSNCGGAG